jgi:hypothetical protein
MFIRRFRGNPRLKPSTRTPPERKTWIPGFAGHDVERPVAQIDVSWCNLRNPRIMMLGGGFDGGLGGFVADDAAG